MLLFCIVFDLHYLCRLKSILAEENLKAKSLSAFVARYPSLHAIRLSMSDYREQDGMTNVPLYAVCSIFN